MDKTGGMKAIKALLLFLHIGWCAYAQQDTIVHSRSLDSVIVISYLNENIIRPLPATQGSYLFSGKKTEVIDLAQILVLGVAIIRKKF